MVTTTATIARQELHATNGEVVAYVVPAAEVDKMRDELATLREQVTRLARQRDHYRADLERVLKSSFPLPPTEAELQEALANPNGLSNLIAELESQ